MFGIISSFVGRASTSLWFYVALIAVIGSLVAGAYFKGVADGSADAYKDGYTQGQASKQPTIDSLTEQINMDAKAANQKITELEKLASDSTDLIVKLVEENKQKKEKIIYKYLQGNPEVAKRIALSLPTVEALNLLLMQDVTLELPDVKQTEEDTKENKND